MRAQVSICKTIPIGLLRGILMSTQLKWCQKYEHMLHRYVEMFGRETGG